MREGAEEHSVAATVQSSTFPIQISIISDVRFVRESLAEILPREGVLSIYSLAADVGSAIVAVAGNRPDIVLFDGGVPDGAAAIGRIRHVAPQIPIVVMAVAETAADVIAWAEAGAAGYIPKTAGLGEIAPLLVGIAQGKQACSESVAAGLLRRISGTRNANGGNPITPPTALTAREAQIVQMIATGMSNKDIARRLNIGLATAKTHVHHVLGKLNLQRRGQAADWLHYRRNVSKVQPPA
ncbi:MAG: response regulator transcription factor [Methylocella sp.]